MFRTAMLVGTASARLVSRVALRPMHQIGPTPGVSAALPVAAYGGPQQSTAVQ